MIDKGQWREFGQDTGVTPLLFTRSAMGFLMTIIIYQYKNKVPSKLSWLKCEFTGMI